MRCTSASAMNPPLMQADIVRELFHRKPSHSVVYNAQTLLPFGNKASLPRRPDRRRLTRIRISFRKNFFERGVVSVDIVVKVNESVLSHDNGAIDD
jgi:hypothetical protein